MLSFAFYIKESLSYFSFRDGRLQEGDQILAINKKLLDSGLTHHEAIAILQESKGDIELIVAKGVPGSLSRSSSFASSSLSRSSSAVSNISQNSVSIPVSVLKCCTVNPYL